MWYRRPKHENIFMSVSQLMWYRRPNIENICIYEIVRVLYGKTIDVILTAEHKNYMRIKKRTVNAPCSSWTRKNTFGVICIYFRYLAVCITLIAKPTCIYFRVYAVCTTLIAKFMSTLLHLAGYFLNYLSQLSSFQC